MQFHSIHLPSWLATGMVFQQGVPLILFGKAQKHALIKLEIVKDPTDGRKVSKLDTDYGIILTREVRTDEEGNFDFELPSYKASTDAYTFIFSYANETVAIKDLRCGDLWLMFGSTPLCVPIVQTAAPRTPLKESALHLMRFLVSSNRDISSDLKYTYEPTAEGKLFSWVTARSGQALAAVSATAFSLAYHLADQLHYPVGIIDLSMDHSSIYSWISRKTIHSFSQIEDYLKEKHLYFDEIAWNELFCIPAKEDEVADETASAPISETKKEITSDDDKVEEIVPGQEFELMFGDIPVNPAKNAEDKTRHQGNISTLTFDIPVFASRKETPEKKDDKPDMTTPRTKVMGLLYNEKLFPLKDMSIRGIVFAPDYEDSELTKNYEMFVRALLTDLSEIFGPKIISSKQSVPSLILMHLRPAYSSDPYAFVNFNESLSAIRRRIPMPIGILSLHDMLLPDKTMQFQIGRRLSTIALGLHFTPKMPTSSPECVGVEIIGNKAMLTFDNTSDGLKLAENESSLRGFAVCGKNRVYYPAHAKVLHGVRVMVWHDDVSEPYGVTYGYYPIPHEATFKSRSDLPVLPFRFSKEDSVYSPDLSFANCDQLSIVGIEKEDLDFALLPAYRVCRGHGSIFLETLNKTEGSASLRIEYVPEEGVFSFSPILSYTSLYAPLDLSSFSKVQIDVFNPDQNAKRVSVEGFVGEVNLKAGLMWQTLQFVCIPDTPLLIRSMEISIYDDEDKGSVYVDNIRFS